MTLTVFDVFRMAIQERGDAYHLHDPELIPAGLLLKLLGKRVVYDVHEHYGKLIRSKFWIPKPLRWLIAGMTNALERSAAFVFDGIVVATPAIAEVFPAPKTVVVQNFALVSEFISIDAADYQTRGHNVAYVGSITRDRGAEEMVKAMASAADVKAPVMLLAGPFAPPSLKADLQREPGYAHVDYLGVLDRQEVQRTLARSRAGLVVLHPESNYLDSYPVKLFEYMSAGLPVIASDFPYWKQFISDIGSGLMVDPLDTGAISDAIRWLLEHPVEAEEMGKRGREAVLTHYSWEGEARKLVDFYRQHIFAGDSVRYETR